MVNWVKCQGTEELNEKRKKKLTEILKKIKKVKSCNSQLILYFNIFFFIKFFIERALYSRSPRSPSKPLCINV